MEKLTPRQAREKARYLASKAKDWRDEPQACEDFPCCGHENRAECIRANRRD